MATYTYTARDITGLPKEGLLQAETTNEALESLHERGLTPTSITQTRSQTRRRRQSPAQSGRVGSAELAAFCWQLSTMLDGGLAITTALGIVAEDTDNPTLKHILHRAFANVSEGRPLSAAFRAFPQVFSQLAIAIIVAGETSGNLGQALHTLADHFENRDTLNKKIRSALAYPIFAMTLISVIVLALMVFVVPRFRRIFEQLHGELPTFTRIFMRGHAFFCHHAWFFLAMPLVVIVGTVVLSKTERGHRILSQFLLRLPLFGKLFSEIFVATFCRTLGTLMEAGVPVLDVFEILRTMTANDVIVEAITRAKKHITDGSNIALSLATAGFFPNMVVKMTQVGEESGSLAPIMRKTSNHYERRINAAINTAIGLLEPALIVIIGIVVLISVIALYLPVFSISDMA